MILIPILGLIYLALLLGGLTMSFVAQPITRRRRIRIATSVGSVPLWLALGLIAILWFTFGKEPPTLGQLQHDFALKRDDLETILRMSDEDSNFSRIALTFVDRTPDGPSDAGRYMENDPKAGLPGLRWSAYREIYKRNGIELGIQRNGSHDAFIMMDSVGLLNRGHATGYVHCAPSAAPDAYRFYPCMVGGEKSSRRFDPDKREEGYSFQKLDDRWYAYDEGPS